ncbi:hypothetical protein L9F63_028102, partial [Diploptera punctata]
NEMTEFTTSKSKCIYQFVQLHDPGIIDLWARLFITAFSLFLAPFYTSYNIIKHFGVGALAASVLEEAMV